MRHRDAPMRSLEYCATLSEIIRDVSLSSSPPSLSLSLSLSLSYAPDIILAQLIVKNHPELYPFNSVYCIKRYLLN